MTVSKVHIKAIEMLLASVTLTMGDYGARHSFFFGPPGSAHWERRMGIEISYNFVDLNLAALYVRSQGPQYLRALPLDDIRSKLTNFLSENFGYIGDSVFLLRDERPLNVWISAEDKAALAQALSESPIFHPTNELTLFPLVTVRVRQTTSTNAFFFVAADTDDLLDQIDERMRTELDPSSFPPQKGFKGRIRKPASWLGVLSPDYRAAIKIRSSILGAVALTQLPQYRHKFSGREVFGGRCTLGSDRLTYSFDEVHTPKCMHDIELSEADSEWLETLAEKVISSDKSVARQLKALEYFHRAWSKPPEERFPILCMALDAIFGDANNATQAVIDGVRATLGDHIAEPQLRSILRIRASVVHGGAPDVYDSSKYAKHYRKFGADPIRDLELVVAECLRKMIFGNSLTEHDDPNAAIFEEARAAGRLPPHKENASILNPKN